MHLPSSLLKATSKHKCQSSKQALLFASAMQPAVGRQKVKSSVVLLRLQIGQMLV
jgi:hypothetical protein